MKTLSVTGTWEESTINFVAAGWKFAFEVLEANAALVMVIATITSAIIIGYLLKIAIEQAYQGFKFLRWKVKSFFWRAYHYIRKHRIARRGRGILMAKWETSLIADILHDALFDANMKKTITDRQYVKFTKLVGKKLNLPDMLPKKLHRAAIRAYLTSKPKLAGPKGKIPGGPPGLHIPAVEPIVVSHSKFLNKMKEKKAA